MEKKILSKGEKESGVKIRKVINHNGSYYICLPKKFIKRHHLAPGDKVVVLLGENLKIVPLEKSE